MLILKKKELNLNIKLIAWARIIEMKKNLHFVDRIK